MDFGIYSSFIALKGEYFFARTGDNKMPKQSIANILLYGMAQQHTPAEFGVDDRIISEVVEGWNRHIYIFPQNGIRLQKNRQKKYDLM